MHPLLIKRKAQCQFRTVLQTLQTNIDVTTIAVSIHSRGFSHLFIDAFYIQRL